MSENCRTIIKAALRVAGIIASEETPTAAEMADGLEALQFMLRNWSARDLRIWYTEQETLTMDGSTSYSIGDGGDIDTVRPDTVRGAWHSNGEVKIIDEAKYRRFRMSAASSGDVAWLWYSPEYPLGLLYPWPLGGSTLYVDTLKPLLDERTADLALGDDLEYPPEYDDAIKWNLACRIAPEYGKEPTTFMIAMASAAIEAIENKNFANKANAAMLEIVDIAHPQYNIDRE